MAADGGKVIGKAQLLLLGGKMRVSSQTLNSHDEEHTHIQHGITWW